MPLGRHDPSVRMFKRLPYWARQTFKTEVIGEKAAFEEAEHERKQRLENMAITDVNHQTYLPLAGGPLDGKAARMPTLMVRQRQGGNEPTIDLPASPNGIDDHLPRERRLFATYRLDRSMMVLRYVGTRKLK